MRHEEVDRRLRVLAASASFRQAAEALGGDISRDALQSWAKDNVSSGEYTRLCIRSSKTRHDMTVRANDRYSRNEGPKPLKAPLTEEGLESLAAAVEAEDELLGTAILEASSTEVTVANLGHAVLDTLEAQAKELKGLREELSQTEDRAKREVTLALNQRDILRRDFDAAQKRIVSLQGETKDESQRITKVLSLTPEQKRW